MTCVPAIGRNDRNDGAIVPVEWFRLTLSVRHDIIPFPWESSVFGLSFFTGPFFRKGKAYR